MAKLELRKDERRGKVVVGLPGQWEKEWKEVQEEANRRGYLTSVNAALSEKVIDAIKEVRTALTAQLNGRVHEEATDN